MTVMGAGRTKGRACQGKQRHPNKDAAERALFRLARAGADRAGLNTYQCRHCGGWHLGHRPHRKARARKQR